MVAAGFRMFIILQGEGESEGLSVSCHATIAGIRSIVLYILTIGVGWWCVANTTLRTLFLQKRTPVPILHRAGWAHVGFGGREENKISCLYRV
jgi:hypothetical protein